MKPRNFTKGPTRNIPVWFDMDLLKALVIGIGAGVILGFLCLTSLFY